MADMTPPVLVQGAPREPLPFGMFSVLPFRDENAAHWQGGGVQWEYLDPEAVDRIGPVQEPYDTTLGFPKNLQPAMNSAGGIDPGFTTANQFTIYGHFTVSPIAWSPEDAQARALAVLTTFEERAVEQTFWFGDMGNYPSLSTNAITVGSYAIDSVQDGLGLLEQFNADHYGSVGVIHMNRQYALSLLRNYAMVVKGRQVYTALGTPVVIGTGYPTGSMRVTPALFGYRSDPFTSSNVRGDLLDKTKNNLYAVAERTYIIGFDPAPVGVVTITG